MTSDRPANSRATKPVHKVFKMMITPESDGSRKYSITFCGAIIWEIGRASHQWADTTCKRCLRTPRFN